MDRRRFLRSAVLGVCAAAVPKSLVAQATPFEGGSLTLRPDRLGPTIGSDFVGLSYESAQLANPAFFSPANTQLIGFLRRLGPQGVLRIGGNTSEYAFWNREAKPSAEAPAAVNPDTGRKAPPRTTITPEAIRNLRGFLDAAGWRLLYGLNFGLGTPANAADESAFVHETMGPALIALQVGNEADLFSRNGIRGPEYGFPQFAEEWRRFRDAIRARVPRAALAGPDTASNTAWLVQFAREFGHDAVLLTQHYYAEGPPTDPSMTLERLLRPNPALLAMLRGVTEARRISGLPFRLAETNSCYSAGKPGVSNTFGSALWGADLMYQLAQAGVSGINFHGGGYGWYTPVAGTLQDGFVARPLFYGMLLFAQAGPGRMVETSLDAPALAPLLTAYALRSDAGPTRVALFNKNIDRGARLRIDAATRAQRAEVLRLVAPRADDTTDVTLGGAPVGADGAWAPAHVEPLAVRDGTATVELPPASAALVTFA